MIKKYLYMFTGHGNLLIVALLGGNISDDNRFYGDV